MTSETALTIALFRDVLDRVGHRTRTEIRAVAAHVVKQVGRVPPPLAIAWSVVSPPLSMISPTLRHTNDSASAKVVAFGRPVRRDVMRQRGRTSESRPWHGRLVPCFNRW